MYLYAVHESAKLKLVCYRDLIGVGWGVQTPLPPQILHRRRCYCRRGAGDTSLLQVWRHPAKRSKLRKGKIRRTRCMHLAPTLNYERSLWKRVVFSAVHDYTWLLNIRFFFSLHLLLLDTNNIDNIYIRTCLRNGLIFTLNR